MFGLEEPHYKNWRLELESAGHNEAIHVGTVFEHFVVLVLALAADIEYLMRQASLSRLEFVEAHFFFAEQVQLHVEKKLKASSMG